MNNVDRYYFGKKLRELRKASGKTIFEVADQIGIGQAHMSLVELGQRSPLDHDKLKVIAAFIKAPYNDLLKAACLTRGKVELELGLKRLGNHGIALALALVNKWPLSEDMAAVIVKIIEREE
jgi:transcriptional regulator with XRE-family HTH domain